MTLDPEDLEAIEKLVRRHSGDFMVQIMITVMFLAFCFNGCSFK